jgi:hypothetical protein
VATAIEVFTLFDKKSIIDSGDEVLYIDGRELYAILSSSDLIDSMLRPDVKSKKTFLDMWDCEIHAKIENINQLQHIILWSNGPNRKNNKCSGDDIVMEFKISKPRTAKSVP